MKPKNPISAFRMMIVAGVSLLLFTSCNSQMSYDAASKMEPYSLLEEKDRQWLFQHHQTRKGALAWLDDEIRLRDDRLDVWFTSDNKIELMEKSGGKTFSIDRDKAYNLVLKKGGRVAAMELVSQAREKIGGMDIAPENPDLLPGMDEELQRAQKLRYPDLWASNVMMESQLIVQQAMKHYEQGNNPKAVALMAEAVEMRLTDLGKEHPATQGALGIFQEYAGLPHDEYTPEKFQQLAQADELIKQANSLLKAGRMGEAVQAAQQAYNIKREILGENHPKVQVIARNIQQAQRRLQ